MRAHVLIHLQRERMFAPMRSVRVAFLSDGRLAVIVRFDMDGAHFIGGVP